MQIGVITKNNDFFELLAQHSVFDINVSFVKYETVAEYNDSKIKNMVVVGSDIAEKVDNKDNVVYIGTDILIPYKISSLFKLIKSKIVNDECNVCGYIFNFKLKTLVKGEVEIDLTEKEANIIKLLIDAYPKTIAKKQLLEDVFGYSDDLDTHTLETHIYRLRKKINIDNDFIITDKGGYKILLNFDDVL